MATLIPEGFEDSGQVYLHSLPRESWTESLERRTYELFLVKTPESHPLALGWHCPIPLFFWAGGEYSRKSVVDSLSGLLIISSKDLGSCTGCTTEFLGHLEGHMPRHKELFGSSEECILLPTFKEGIFERVTRAQKLEFSASGMVFLASCNKPIIPAVWTFWFWFWRFSDLYLLISEFAISRRFWYLVWFHLLYTPSFWASQGLIPPYWLIPPYRYFSVPFSVPINLLWCSVVCETTFGDFYVKGDIWEEIGLRTW